MIFLRALLILTLIWPAQFSLASPPSVPGPDALQAKKLEYLKILKDRVVYFMQKNMELADQKLICVRNYPEVVQFYKPLAEKRLTDPSVSLGEYAKYKVCNDWIQMKDKDEKTGELVEHPGYDDVLNFSYTEMREYLALSQAVIPFRGTPDMFELDDAHRPYQMNVRPQHTFPDLAVLPPLNPDEVNGALEKLEKARAEAEASYQHFKSKKDEYLRQASPAEMQFRKSNPYFRWKDGVDDPKERMDDLWQQMQSQRNVFYQDYLNRISHFTPIAYMSHPLHFDNPVDRLEFISIVQKAQAINQKNYQMVKSLPEKYYSLLPLMAYEVVVKSEFMQTFDQPYVDDKSVSAAVAADYFHFMLFQSGKVMAEVVAANLACNFIVGRVFQLAKIAGFAWKLFSAAKGTINLGCGFGTGLAFNYGFYVQARHDYERIFAEFISSSEGNLLLREASELDAADNARIFSLLTMFVGVGAVPVGKTLWTYLGLSSKGKIVFAHFRDALIACKIVEPIALPE